MRREKAANRLAGYFSLLGVLVFVVLGLGSIVTFALKGPDLGFLMVVGTLGAYALVAHLISRVHVWAWRGIALAKYQQEVPAFVLQRALEIKKELPEAEFSIELLAQTSRFADPFLVVYCVGERYYVDVWDEPNFQAERQS